MIRDFYAGRHLLVTGSTGFLGQAMVAKILRDLPDVAGLYLLMRGRRQRDGTLLSPAERLDEDLFSGSVFARWRGEDPTAFAAARAKTQAIQYDMSATDLGIPAADRQMLLEHVDGIISSAATVVFDEPLDLAVQVNTLGPQQLLELARQCRQRVVFIHVSTAYVSGRRSGTIAEELLPVDRTIQQLMTESDARFDPEAEVRECLAYCQRIRARADGAEQQRMFRQEILSQRHNRALSAARLAKLMEDRRKRWVERQLTDEGMRRAQRYGWNDVYTFTKAMGEQLLTLRHGDVPLVIVRPSIIESSLVDPEPGWIHGLKVADPLIVGYGRGLVPDFPTRRDVALDLVPVDVVVNTVLAAGTRAGTDTVPVYHAATSGVRPLFMQAMYDHVRAYFRQHPMRGHKGETPELPEWSFPRPERFLRRLRWRYLHPLRLQQWLFAHLPERLVPAQRKRRLAALEKRLLRVVYYTELFGPYARLDCRYLTDRAQELYASLPKDEQRLFDMDVKRIEWSSYLSEIHIPGLRRHVLGERQSGEALLRGAPQEVGAEEEQWRIEEGIHSIPDLIRWACSRYGDQVALRQVAATGVREWRYAELLEAVDGLGEYWQRQGMQPGTRVLLCASSGPRWVVAYLAASCLGLQVVPVDTCLTTAEIWALARLAQVQALLVDTATWMRMSPGSANTEDGSAPGVFIVDQYGARAGDAFPMHHPPASERWRPPAVDADQIASIIYVTGSRGVARGVVLRHRNLIAAVLGLAEVHRLGADDHLLSLLPLWGTGEFTAGLLSPLLGGASITYLARAHSASILGALRRYRITMLQVAPGLLRNLGRRATVLQAAAGVGEQGQEVLRALRGLRVLVSGGAALPASVLEQYRRLGVSLYEGYALPEATAMVSVSAPEGARWGSVGRALPQVEVRVADADAAGNGEILVRGPTVMAGYLDQPELSAEILRDGWLHTGDLGRVDADGYLYVTGRCRPRIVTGTGRSIDAEEVETLYAGLPYVNELAVVGVFAARTLGESMHAVVVPEPTEASSEEEVAAAIRGAAREISRSLPAHQRVRVWHIWEQPLPRLDSGDVDRVALQAELARRKQPTPVTSAAVRDLAPSELGVCARVARITGLSVDVVVAYVDAPLDLLMDSLMAVELAALLPGSDAQLLKLDRGRMTLRDVFVLVKPGDLGADEPVGAEAGDTPAASYWSTVLASAGERGGEVEVAGAGVPGCALQAPLWAVLGPLFRTYFRLRIKGVEHLPTQGPYLLAANHCSHLDSFAVLAALRPLVDCCQLVAAQDYLSRSPLRGWAVEHLVRVVPFDRYGDFREGVLLARSLLGTRRPLLVFPEGTRSANGQLQPFKLGIGLLAHELHLPVVPVHIHGTYQALPRGKTRPRRHPLRVSFGAALAPDALRERTDLTHPYAAYRAIAQELRRRIEALGTLEG